MQNNKIECKYCGFEFEWLDAIYCPECGNNLLNLCTNPKCEMNPNNENYEENSSFPRSFKHCPECGYETTYCKSLTFDASFPQKGQ